MSCKITKIENKYRESNPELADKLNQLTLDTWNKVIDSNLFERKNNELYADQPGTDNRVKQDEFISSDNNIQITEDNKVSVDVLRNDNQSLQEGLDWLKSVNPNVQPEIVQGLIDGIANGSYNSNLDLITLSKQFANKSTIKHEFLHKILNSLPFEQREAILNEASKKYGIARGESKTTTKYSQVQQNEINYTLKAVDILQSAKGDEIFRKGDKNNWNIDKILQELQVPKDQQELIKSFNTRNREEIITNLLANYSYTVEINTTTKENDRGIDDEIIEHNGKFMLQTSFDDSGPYHEIFNTKQEAVSYLKKLRQNPTNYYSNLTVPGGTAYTEQEIATPLITPSIKGHAQFSTDFGIGWTRTDEKVQYTEQDIDSLIDILKKSGQLEINCK